MVRLAGWLVTVARSGQLIWTDSYGHRDREAGLEVTDDTIWRIYSMTKPLTSIAVMMLYEKGCFDLNFLQLRISVGLYEVYKIEQ